MRPSYNGITGLQGHIKLCKIHVTVTTSTMHRARGSALNVIVEIQ
jgi:hypothetical protein